MGHPPKRSRDASTLKGALESETFSTVAPVIEAGESDDEYEDIPAFLPQSTLPQVSIPDKAINAHQRDVERVPVPPPDATIGEIPQVAESGTDDDWLRSKTSRLLDLVDPDDPGFTTRLSAAVPASIPVRQPSPTVVEDAPQGDASGTSSTQVAGRPQPGGLDDPAELVQRTCRLFLRNLNYTATEDDISEHFSAFGNLNEVSTSLFFRLLSSMMNPR